MENASKALLIAGGVLIAILILSALVYGYANLSSYQNTKDSMLKAEQIAEFNNKLEPYNKKDLTLMELKSLYNKIIDINQKGDIKVDHNITSVYKDIAQSFSKISKDDKTIYQFECVEVKYNSEGMINYMKFETVKEP